MSTGVECRGVEHQRNETLFSIRALTAEQIITTGAQYRGIPSRSLANKEVERRKIVRSDELRRRHALRDVEGRNRRVFRRCKQRCRTQRPCKQRSSRQRHCAQKCQTQKALHTETLNSRDFAHDGLGQKKHWTERYCTQMPCIQIRRAQRPCALKRCIRRHCTQES